MKLYLAFKDSNTLMDGCYQELQRVFDSEEKAWNSFKKDTDFKYSEPTKKGKSRVYHFDGELSYYWYVEETVLNEPRSK